MTNYPRDLYAQSREGVKSSAAVVAPRLIDLFSPASVIDVGCGEGHWLAEFAARGCTVTGVDGPHVEPDCDFIVHDLEQPLRLDQRFDLALCLEVAEHVSPARAPAFVAELCTLAPTVVFSAAIPGQGGSGHVGEAWPAYWAGLFAENGYPGTGALRWPMWMDQRVKDWYRQNLLVFGDLHGLPEDGCAAVVHPECWDWHRR